MGLPKVRLRSLAVSRLLLIIQTLILRGIGLIVVYPLQNVTLALLLVLLLHLVILQELGGFIFCGSIGLNIHLLMALRPEL